MNKQLDEGLNRMRKGGVNASPPADVKVPPPPPPQRIRESTERTGGVKPPPTSPRPSAPQAEPPRVKEMEDKEKKDPRDNPFYEERAKRLKLLDNALKMCQINRLQVSTKQFAEALKIAYELLEVANEQRCTATTMRASQKVNGSGRKDRG